MRKQNLFRVPDQKFQYPKQKIKTSGIYNDVPFGSYPSFQDLIYSKQVFYADDRKQTKKKQLMNEQQADYYDFYHKQYSKINPTQSATIINRKYTKKQPPYQEKRRLSTNIMTNDDFSFGRKQFDEFHRKKHYQQKMGSDNPRKQNSYIKPNCIFTERQIIHYPEGIDTRMVRQTSQQFLASQGIYIQPNAQFRKIRPDLIYQYASRKNSQPICYRQNGRSKMLSNIYDQKLQTIQTQNNIKTNQYPSRAHTETQLLQYPLQDYNPQIKKKQTSYFGYKQQKKSYLPIQILPKKKPLMQYSPIPLIKPKQKPKNSLRVSPIEHSSVQKYHLPNSRGNLKSGKEMDDEFLKDLIDTSKKKPQFQEWKSKSRKNLDLNL